MIKRVKGEWADSLPYTDKAFEPLALVLGQLTLVWNDLHESLAIVFCSVMGGGNIGHLLAIWHALNVDRAQREILKAAVKSGLSPGQQNEVGRRKVTNDIIWLCDRANDIEDTRNDALHVPFWGTRTKGQKPIIAPLTGLGHIRAEKFLGKDILSELRWFRDYASLLRNFAIEIDHALSDYKRPWPDRPKLPVRPATSDKKPPRPAHNAKPPPRSSPG